MTFLQISRQFPELPSLDEIERNRSLNFINSHRGLDVPLPLLPTEVPVAGIHLRPAKPLPQVRTVSTPSVGRTSQTNTFPAGYFFPVTTQIQHLHLPQDTLLPHNTDLTPIQCVEHISLSLTSTHFPHIFFNPQCFGAAIVHQQYRLAIY